MLSKALAATVGGAGFLLASTLALQNTGIQFPDGTVQTTAAAGAARKLVYLTSATVTGDQALSACTAPGYHMASIAEVPNPRELVYDHDATGALLLADQGEGMPAGVQGWMRSGTVAHNDGPGVGLLPNCLAWTTTAGFGLTVFYGHGTSWEFVDVADVVDPELCATAHPVWCVAD